MSQTINSDGLEFLDAFKSSTRSVYRSALTSFLNFYRDNGLGKTIADFLDSLESDLLRPRRERAQTTRKVLRDYIKFLEENNRSPTTIRTYVAAVQSLARYYDLNLSSKYIQLPSRQPASSKHAWTLQEIGLFIGNMHNVELKSISATMFQSGISLGDLLELTYDDIRLEFESQVSPLCFDLTRRKTDTPFMTFIGEYGLMRLREYIHAQGQPDPSDRLYSMHKRVVERNFAELARKTIGKYTGSNPMRPHSLRSAFNTLLADAGVPQDDREFFMGHRLPEQRRVYLSRSREGWRGLYKKYESALTPG